MLDKIVIPDYLELDHSANINPPVETHKQVLPLKLLTWEQFESLIYKLIKKSKEIENCYIYGIKGQNQQGIDIFSKKDFENNYSTYQCKRVKKYTQADIKEAVDLFIKGNWLNKSNQFIICSTFSFNDIKLRDEIENQKIVLSKNNVYFDVWDNNELSIKLKNYPDLVYEFFGDNWLKAFLGDEVAERFYSSFGKYKSIQEAIKISYEKPANYIDRNYIETDNGSDLDYLISDEYKSKTILDILEQNKNIVILSEAANGKTTELEFIAYSFSIRNDKVFPFKFSLGNYTGENIEDMIPSAYKNLPISNIQFIFDGLDEIPTKSRNIFVKRIEKFTDENPKSRFIISCRSNVYNRETNDFTGTIKNFKTFILKKLNGYQIEKYIEINIDEQDIDNFNNEVFRNSLSDLMSNPFYLISLIKIYNKEKSLPKRISHIYEKLINISFNFDTDHYRTTEELFENELLLRKCLMRIALIMELIGKVEITELDLEKIIPKLENRKLLKCSGLINKLSNGCYQFIHNNFREYLIAKSISELEFDTIKKFLFSGDKINPKRHNVFSFLISILDKESDIFKELEGLISGDELEILINFENDKLNLTLRNEIFQKIFNYHKEKNIYIDRYKFNFRKLAHFAESEETLNFLLEEIKICDNIYLKCNAIEIIGDFNNQKVFNEKIMIALIDQIKTENFHVRYNCMRTIADLKLNSLEVIKEILKILEGTNNDYENAGIYYMIFKSKYLDDYIEIFLSGIKRTKHTLSIGNVESETRIGDEQIYLVEGLENIKSPEALKIFANYFKLNPSDFMDIYFHRFDKLVESLVEAYHIDNTVYNFIFELFIELHKSHIEGKELKLLDTFFEKTNTSVNAFIDIYSLNIEDYTKWKILGYITNVEVLMEILKRYKEGSILDDDIKKYLHSIRWQSNIKYEEHYSIINRETHDKFIFEEVESPDYDKLRKEGLQNYFDLLFDKNRYLEHIEEIFNSLDKDEIDVQDSIDFRKDLISESKPNDFLINELFRDNSKSIIRRVETLNFYDKINWDIFVIKSIYKYLINDWDITLSEYQKDWISNWCLSNLNSVNFKNALKVNGSNYTVTSNNLIYLWFYLRYLKLKYPKYILLDLLSFDWIKGVNWIGIEYLNEFLEFDEIKKRIIENIHDGNENQIALFNQLQYCKKNNIIEVVKYLEDILENENYDLQIRNIALDTFLSFSRSYNTLKDIIFTANDFKWIIVYKLIKEKNENLENELLELFNSSEGQEKLKAAVFLNKYQNLESIKYFSELIEKDKKVPYLNWSLDYSPYNQIKGIETLPFIMKMLESAYKIDFVDSDFYSFKSILLDVIKNIALDNSEVNFPIVKTALENFIIVNKSNNPVVSYIHRNIDDMEKQYYLLKSESISIEDAIKKVNEIILL